MPSGKIIFLNGASSSGKTTLAKALQRALPEPFLYFSFDHFRDANILPMERILSGEFHWPSMREQVFEAFHRSAAAMAEAGCNVLVEHIIETEAWNARLKSLLADKDVFRVGIHCPLEELERRERSRGDRPIGDAKRDFETCHTFCVYDFEVDATRPAEENARAVIQAWQNRNY